MTARVFISHRASNGTGKATSLARDLDELFGGAQLFPDLEDLRAGGRWRDEVARPFEARPWRRLRACDWREGLARLAADLEPLGVERVSEPGGQRSVELAVRIEGAAGGEAVEHGTLKGAIEADERRMRGRLRLHGERAERAVDLRRDR